MSGKEGSVYLPGRFRHSWRQRLLQVQDECAYLYKVDRRTALPTKCVARFFLEELQRVQPLASMMATTQAGPLAATSTTTNIEEHGVAPTRSKVAALQDPDHPYVFTLTFAAAQRATRSKPKPTTLYLSTETIEEHWAWTAFFGARLTELQVVSEVQTSAEEAAEVAQISPSICTVELFPKQGIRLHQYPDFVPAPLLKSILAWPESTFEIDRADIERKHSQRGWYAHVPMSRSHVLRVMQQFGWKMTQAVAGISVGKDAINVKPTQIFVFEKATKEEVVPASPI